MCVDSRPLWGTSDHYCRQSLRSDLGYFDERSECAEPAVSAGVACWTVAILVRRRSQSSKVQVQEARSNGDWVAGPGSTDPGRGRDGLSLRRGSVIMRSKGWSLGLR